MTELPNISTDRLLLRPWRDSDLEPFAALNADARVMEFFVNPLPREHSDKLAAYIQAHFDRHGFGLWAAETADCPFIGFIGLAWGNFDAPFMPALEVGFRLAQPHWGKGYATEGGKAAVAWAFANTDVPAVHSWTSRLNLRSQSAILKIGLKHMPGLDFEHPRVPEGHRLRPHLHYMITR
jgi:ribosomal-protein-alanine N-acetyltransferase